MSYQALLSSLASTPKGDDDWRTVFGSLLRQAHNDGVAFRPPTTERSGESQRQEARRRGVTLYRVRVDRGASIGKGPRTQRTRMVSATQIVRDLRSVGWGGDDKQVREAYNVMMAVFTLPTSRLSQNRDDLNSFNAKPLQGWLKNERGNADRYVSHATVIVIPEGSPASDPLIRLWGSNTKRLPTVYGALLDIRQAYDQDLPIDLADSEYVEKIITYEYAGARHLVRS